MRIQCNVCEVAQANILCWADEAALCWSCDEKIHAANKLASKHQRVSLSNSSSQPKCDICQETPGYFFCLEDRALLCRKCDIAIHTANTYVSAHQRFLLPGVKVGLEPTEPGLEPTEPGGTSSVKSHLGVKISETGPHPLSTEGVPLSSTAGQLNNVLPVEVGGFAQSNLSFAGGSATGSVQPWQFDELLGLTELNENYEFMDNASSKADSGKLGDSVCSPILQAVELMPDAEECLGQVPEPFWAVPQVHSPPTASGLFWSGNSQPQRDTAASVPDVMCSPMQNTRGASLKRRRHF